MAGFEMKGCRILDGKKHIALWGSGGLAKQVLFDWLPNGRIEVILDSNPAKQGTKLHGITIVEPENFSFEAIDCVIIGTTATLEVREHLLVLGYKGAVVNSYELLLPENSSSMSEWEKLKIDILVQRSGSLFSFLLDRPQIWANITYRLCRHAKAVKWLRPLLPVLQFWHSLATAFLSIYIPITVDAGPGLSFAHYGTIVFRGGVHVGNFFTIYHNATLGSDEMGDHPTIGDFVTVYTGATLIGKCDIGDYTRIGAHTLCRGLKTNGYCTVVGNPARVVRDYSKLRIAHSVV